MSVTRLGSWGGDRLSSSARGAGRQDRFEQARETGVEILAAQTVEPGRPLLALGGVVQAAYILAETSR